MIYKFTYPQINERNTAEYKTLIVIGESGSGKTSFLNFLCNYYLGVKSEDNFRFLLIKENLYGKSQAMSQTQDINIYYLRPYDKLVGLKIIDTPGFGDSRGIEQDMKIAQQIKELFQKKVETVTAICFVVKASQSRSTISQNYILNQMKQYFGLDVKQNIIFIFPFSTAENPLAIESLRFQGNESQMANEVSELVNEFIDKSMKTKDEWFFKVDNKAILYNFNSSNEQECQFYKFLWDMSYSSFQKLIENKLLRIKDNSLQLTKAVIAKRDNLVLQVQAYKQKLNKNVELQKAIYDEIEKIEKWDEKISNAKNNIQFYKEKKVKVPISKDESVTNCNICENTCHYICFIDGNNKLYCEAMDDFYNCTICEKKCHYTAHQNDRFRYEINLEADEIEVEKYQKKCQDKKLSKQQILKDIEEQQKQNSVQFLQNAQKIFEIYNELRTIALAPSHYENQAQIVEEMIQQELSEQNDGYVKRVAILRQLKEQLEDIQEVSSKSKSIANEEQQGKKDQLEDLLKPSQSLTSTNRSRSVAPTKRS
ncbi:unnamed protein product [Paramecium sonneborni]|uniref:Septin-type G domain-containing protein n=1 Tax=Paramecium sonneborni TaxID=65129 RepID=A0A8S1R203_9CILI|nr:unnamed protein product [Paramecium sonneborni]